MALLILSDSIELQVKSSFRPVKVENLRPRNARFCKGPSINNVGPL